MFDTRQDRFLGPRPRKEGEWPLVIKQTDAPVFGWLTCEERDDWRLACLRISSVEMVDPDAVVVAAETTLQQIYAINT